MRFLRDTRLRQGAALLEQTSLRVGEIAARVGFKDPLYFSRTLARSSSAVPWLTASVGILRSTTVGRFQFQGPCTVIAVYVRPPATIPGQADAALPFPRRWRTACRNWDRRFLHISSPARPTCEILFRFHKARKTRRPQIPGPASLPESGRACAVHGWISPPSRSARSRVKRARRSGSGPTLGRFVNTIMSATTPWLTWQLTEMALLEKPPYSGRKAVNADDQCRLTPGVSVARPAGAKSARRKRMAARRVP